jgi:hypothetical protein
MGNSLSAQYEIKEPLPFFYYVHLIDSEPLAGGINGVWRVQQATKRANSQPCAIFVFDKKQAARFNPLARPDGLVRDIEQLSRSLKTEVQVITRMRHPSILQIVVPKPLIGVCFVQFDMCHL